MHRQSWLLATLLMLAEASFLLAAASETFITAEQAPIDYALQGEYVGKLPGETGELQAYGAQIIALGQGQFHGLAYAGGLPGAGWNGSQPHEADGKLEQDRILFPAIEGNMTATLREGKLTVADSSGRSVGVLEKVSRQSPTLGAKPPAGAVVLFDGSGLDQWQPGAKREEDLLAQGATSKPKFQSFKIHLEFRTPFMPEARGQGRGNSGFYAQGRYECQVLDSFGLKGEHNECGGIYSVKAPDVNMCLPPLAWQTYDIEFEAASFENGQKVADARMTVLHNGVKIHDRVAVPHATTAAPLREGPEPGPIFLQDHGNPVRYRNIWVAPR